MNQLLLDFENRLKALVSKISTCECYDQSDIVRLVSECETEGNWLRVTFDRELKPFYLANRFRLPILECRPFSLDRSDAIAMSFSLISSRESALNAALSPMFGTMGDALNALLSEGLREWKDVRNLMQEIGRAISLLANPETTLPMHIREIDLIHSFFDRLEKSIRSCVRDHEQYHVWFAPLPNRQSNWDSLREIRREENEHESQQVQLEIAALAQQKKSLRTSLALARNELLSRTANGDPEDIIDKAENILRSVLDWYRQDESSYWGDFIDASSDVDAAIVVEQLQESDARFPLRQTAVDRIVEELRIAESIVLRPYAISHINNPAEELKRLETQKELAGLLHRLTEPSPATITLGRTIKKSQGRPPLSEAKYLQELDDNEQDVIRQWNLRKPLNPKRGELTELYDQIGKNVSPTLKAAAVKNVVAKWEKKRKRMRDLETK